MVRRQASLFRVPSQESLSPVEQEKFAATLPDPDVTTVRVVQANANTTLFQNDAVRTSAQVHVAGLARNGQSMERKPRLYENAGRRRRKTNGQTGTTRSFGHPASRRITSPPVPSHSCQIPPSRLTLRFLVIFSAQHLPVYDDPSLITSAVANMCA